MGLFSRKRESGGGIGAALFGVILFFGSFALIWWNEGRSVDRIDTLAVGRGSVVSVDAAAVNAANLGKLVHISGEATTEGQVFDSQFGVGGDFLKLRREVEMYQWVERRETKGESTSYRYERSWRDELIRSSSFNQPSGHQNPGSMPLRGQTQTARGIKLGGFTLSQAFVGQMSRYQDLDPVADAAGDKDPLLQQRYHPEDGYLVDGSLSSPRIGDVRIKFSAVFAGPYSAVGKQTGTGLDTFVMEKGEIELLQAGSVPAQSMFEAAETANTLLTWALRVGGVAAMWGGLAMLMSPLRSMANLIPFLGRLVGAGITLVTGVTAFVLSFTTAAIAWIAHRPLVGGILLAIAVIGFFGGSFLIKSRQRRSDGDAGFASASAGGPPPPPPPPPPPGR
ncbi:MAG: TMEM43 family protein [Magnetospiraceae bacterium]